MNLNRFMSEQITTYEIAIFIEMSKKQTMKAVRHSLDYSGVEVAHLCEISLGLPDDEDVPKSTLIILKASRISFSNWIMIHSIPADTENFLNVKMLNSTLAKMRIINQLIDEDPDVVLILNDAIHWYQCQRKPYVTFQG